MNDRLPRPTDAPIPLPNQSDKMTDGQFLAHALIAAFRTFIGLAVKRWPELR